MNKLLISGALVGALILGAVGGAFLFPGAPAPQGVSGESETTDNGGDEPLYWVAPMDDTYRRDQPGKSPMGMDLVPVYAEDQPSQPGDVRIDPSVQHNFGLTLGEVTRGPVNRPVTTTGYVMVNQDLLKHYHVRAQGWIHELSVATEGDPVEAGQKLFEFYSPEIVNIQREYLQALREQRPALARSSLATLRAKGVSEREINRLEETRAIRERLHYYADRDGYVFNLGVREGNFVDLPQNLMSLASLDQIWVLVEVFERQAGLLSEGQSVTLTTEAYPGEQWQGRLDYLYPNLDESRRTLRARLVFPNEDGRLKPGMFVRARIDTAEREAVLTAPASAIIRTGDGDRVVKRVGPDRFRSVPVTTGPSVGKRVEILAGLAAGDQVVVDGQFLIDSESSREADLSRLDSPEPADEPTMDTMDREGSAHDGMDHGTSGHEGMDMGTMNADSMTGTQDAMSHDSMDQDQMDHSAMDHSDHNEQAQGGQQ